MCGIAKKPKKEGKVFPVAEHSSVFIGQLRVSCEADHSGKVLPTHLQTERESSR